VVDLDALEIQVRYALHQVRACLGEPIEVVRDPAGNIRVQGLVENEKRKAELLATLVALGHADRLSADIWTMTEAASHVYEPSVLNGEYSEVRTGRLPIEDYLEAYFRERAAAGGDSISGRVTELISEAVSGGEAALAEVWALRRLAERYPAEKFREMDSHSQRLLELMLRDHLTALWTRIADTRRLVEPVIVPLAGMKAGEEAGLMGAPAAGAAGSPRYGLTPELFGTVRQINDLLRALFAAGESPVLSESGHEGRTRLHLKTIEEGALDLLRAFRSVEGEFQELESGVNRVFLGDRQARSQAHGPER
jgi:hypothetical protein